jgi:hypothetical protein
MGFNYVTTRGGNMSIKRIILVVLILITPSLLFAQIGYKPKLRVILSITADEEFHGLISSFLNRELRALHDVEIDEVDPQFEIFILARKITDTQKSVLGVIFSVVMFERFNNEALYDMYQPEKKVVADFLTSDLRKFKGQYVHTGSQKDIRRICESIIADFDSYVLEPQRKIYRGIDKQFEPLRKKMREIEINKEDVKSKTQPN